jgi:glycosyltransferase involved in cell wall biosynthesis
MIEAMACGTPVLAFRHGSVPEIVDEGVTGSIVDSIEEAVSALARVLSLDREVVRRRFEERFSAARMAQDYLNLYQLLLSTSNRSPQADRQPTRPTGPMQVSTNVQRSRGDEIVR